MEVFKYLQPNLSKYLNVMVYVIFVQIEYTSFNFKFGAKLGVTCNQPKIYTWLSKNKRKTMKKIDLKQIWMMDNFCSDILPVGITDTIIVENQLYCRCYPYLKCWLE